MGEEKRALRRATMGKGAAMFLYDGREWRGEEKEVHDGFFLGSFFLYRV